MFQEQGMAITLSFERCSPSVWFTQVWKSEKMWPLKCINRCSTTERKWKKKTSSLLDVSKRVIQISKIQYFSKLCGCKKKCWSWPHGLFVSLGFFFENLSRKKHYLFPIKLFKTNPASVNIHKQVKTMTEWFKKKSWHILSGTEIKNFIVYFKSSWKLLNYLFFLSWTEFLTDISPFPLFIFECWIIFNYHEHSACIKELTNHYCQLLHTYVLPTHEVSKTEKRKNWL